MKSRLVEIDALRGLAAVVVAFIFHQHYLTGQFQSGPLDGLPVFTWIHVNGWVAVDLFFVISGFIFAYIYAQDLSERPSGPRFFRARLARLYPLHILTLLVCAAILAIGTPASAHYVKNDLWDFFLNVLMLQESGLQTGKSFNVPSWSISVELFCYVVFYVIVSRIPRQVYLLSASLAILGFLATLADNSTVDHIGRGFCGFFAGVFAFRFRDAPRAGILAAFLALSLAVLLVQGASAGAKLGLGLFPAMVVFACRFSFLRHRALTWLGDRSYSIYMLHIPIYMALNVLVFGSEPIPAEWVWPAIILAWTVILALSDWSYRLVETPARRWINSLPTPANTPESANSPASPAQNASRA